MSVWSAETSSCRWSGACASRFRCLWTVQRWVGTSGHSAASAFSRPAAPSTIRNSGVFGPRATRSSRSARQAASLSPPNVLHGEQHLLAVAAHAEDDEERDRRRFLVEPDAHDGAAEDQPDDVFLG